MPPKYIRELGSDNDRKLYERAKLLKNQNKKRPDHTNFKKTKSSPQLVPLIQMQANNLNKLDHLLSPTSKQALVVEDEGKVAPIIVKQSVKDNKKRRMMEANNTIMAITPCSQHHYSV